MAQSDKNSAANGEEADFAKAFQELARGEQTATALENHLTALEAKIEEMLAQADADQSGPPQAQQPSSHQENSSTDASK